MKIAVIGAGFSGLASAALLAKQGHEVTIFEKNQSAGGRAWVYKEKGFTFDMGPSWYMMPETHERFFALFNAKPSDFYTLKKLDPAYKVVEGATELVISPDLKKTKASFNVLETGAGARLEQLLKRSKDLYDISMNDILYTDQLKVSDLVSLKFIGKYLRGGYFRNYNQIINSYFESDILRHTMKFMTVFLGGSPQQLPGLYTLMAYADMGRKIWYPMGGFGEVVAAYEEVARTQGVVIHYDEPVTGIVKDEKFTLKTEKDEYLFDVIVASCEYSHVENDLLPTTQKSINWQKKNVSPSGILIYLGLNSKVPNLEHHTMFFNTDWDSHFDAIEEQRIAEQPLFYVSCPSKTDSSVAPDGFENVFILVPQPAGVRPSKKQLKSVRRNVLTRLSGYTGIDIEKHIVVERVEDSSYFELMFNAQDGNAFGLTHTLFQSSIFRPPIKSKKVEGLYFTGQFTNPGTGVPLVVMSAEVVTNRIMKDFS